MSQRKKTQTKRSFSLPTTQSKPPMPMVKPPKCGTEKNNKNKT